MSWSPYNYVANSPVIFFDRDGRIIEGDVDRVEDFKDEANRLKGVEAKRQAKLQNKIDKRSAAGKSTARQERRIAFRNTLREILNLFRTIEPKALSIWHGGVFVALGKPLKSSNPSLDGGILMTDQPDPSNSRVVEQIDANVYLYDDLIY